MSSVTSRGSRDSTAVQEAESALARAQAVLADVSKCIHSALAANRTLDLDQYAEGDHRVLVNKRTGELVPAEAVKPRKPRLIQRLGHTGQRRVGQMTYEPHSKQWVGNDDEVRAFSPNSTPLHQTILRRTSGLQLITPNSPQYQQLMGGMKAAPGAGAGMRFDEESRRWVSSVEEGEGAYDEMDDVDMDSPNDSGADSAFSGVTSDNAMRASVDLSDMNAAAAAAAVGSGMRFDKEKMAWIRDKDPDDVFSDSDKEEDPFENLSEEEEVTKGDFLNVGEFDISESLAANWRKSQKQHTKKLGAWFAPGDAHNDRTFLDAIKKLAITRLVAQAMSFHAGVAGAYDIDDDLGAIDSTTENESETNEKHVDELDDDFGGEVNLKEMQAKLTLQQATQHISSSSAFSGGEGLGSDWGSSDDGSEGKSDVDSSGSGPGRNRRGRRGRAADLSALDDLDPGWAPSSGDDALDRGDRDKPQFGNANLDAWREDPAAKKAAKEAANLAKDPSPTVPAKSDSAGSGLKNVQNITPAMFAQMGKNSAPVSQKPLASKKASGSDSDDMSGFDDDSDEGSPKPEPKKNNLNAWADGGDSDSGFEDFDAPNDKLASAKKGSGLNLDALKGFGNAASAGGSAGGSKMQTITPDMLKAMSAGGSGSGKMQTITPDMLKAMSGGGVAIGGGISPSKPGSKMQTITLDMLNGTTSATKTPATSSPAPTAAVSTPVKVSTKKPSKGGDSVSDEEWDDVDVPKSPSLLVLKQGEMPEVPDDIVAGLPRPSKGDATTDSPGEEEYVEQVSWEDVGLEAAPEMIKRLQSAKLREHSGGSPKPAAPAPTKLASEDEEDWDDLQGDF